MNNVRVRDIIAKKTAPEPQVDDRAARYAANAKRHQEEQNAANSWMNEQKIRNYLTNQHDATPVEVQDVLDLLATATHFRQEDFENGSAVNTALATVRGE